MFWNKMGFALILGIRTSALSSGLKNRMYLRVWNFSKIFEKKSSHG
jgi:hypothetical protein